MTRGMHRRHVSTGVTAAAVAAMVLTMCQPVPVTERRQVSFIPEEQLLSLSREAYQQVLEENGVVRGTAGSRLVENVGERVREATERYMRQNELDDRLEGYDWEFNLIEGEAANAFAMPGGKIGVFTGMLQVVQNESQLAVVVAHEVAHVVAEHGNERMSQAMLVQLGGMALERALSESPEQVRQIFLAAYGLGAQVGVQLPYSRLHETEADKLGLVFMAMAGYDPRTAITFWQRMQRMQEGPQPPEFISTHPEHGRRLENLREFMPEALEYYRPEVAAPADGELGRIPLSP